MRTRKPWEEEDGLDKLRKFCAWQERCRSEAWTKLSLLGCPRADMDRLLDRLEDEGFLDEGRFARAYARGKFGLKGWGRIKIREALRGKRIPEALIQEALSLIDEGAYRERAASLLRKKAGATDRDDWEAVQKLRQHLERKGYEAGVIDQAVADWGQED